MPRPRKSAVEPSAGKKAVCADCSFEPKTESTDAWTTRLLIESHVQRRHSGEKLVSCSLCAYASAVRADVTRHMKAAHKTEADAKRFVVDRRTAATRAELRAMARRLFPEFFQK